MNEVRFRTASSRPWNESLAARQRTGRDPKRFCGPEWSSSVTSVGAVLFDWACAWGTTFVIAFPLQAVWGLWGGGIAAALVGGAFALANAPRLLAFRCDRCRAREPFHPIATVVWVERNEAPDYEIVHARICYRCADALASRIVATGIDVTNLTLMSGFLSAWARGDGEEGAGAARQFLAVVPQPEARA